MLTAMPPKSEVKVKLGYIVVHCKA